MKTFVLDHSLSFSFRQCSAVMWTGTSQTHIFRRTTLNYNACYLFFSQQNTAKHPFTGIHLSPFQSPKSFMTSHWPTKYILATEKYCKHVLLISNHHHNDRQPHIPLLFVWMNSLHEDSKTGCAFITQEINVKKREHNFTGPQDQRKDFQKSTLSN